LKLPLKIAAIVFFFLTSELSFSQPQTEKLRIMFYNTENLFDTYNDSLKNDEEFLPRGDKNWTYKRFQEKLGNLAKVIVTAGGWKAPAIVGLCEVENRYVVEQLIRQPQLAKTKYRIIHKESPDERGIDVSLIYDSQRFTPVNYECLPLLGRDSLPLSTREILHVTGIVEGTSDTIHLFVNHWPSRYGGLLETTGLRELAAKTLAVAVNAVYAKSANPAIVITGDFNDQPSDASILKLLELTSEKGNQRLVDLSADWQTKDFGTIKFRSQWSVYDQIIVSKDLLDSSKNIYCSPSGAGILKNDFLLVKDRQYGGVRLFRTYSGMKYLGGFSDHLPVYLDLFFRKP
jgi:predicted extracellular nuclease